MFLAQHPSQGCWAAPLHSFEPRGFISTQECSVPLPEQNSNDQVPSPTLPPGEAERPDVWLANSLECGTWGRFLLLGKKWGRNTAKKGMFFLYFLSFSSFTFLLSSFSPPCFFTLTFLNYYFFHYSLYSILFCKSFRCTA